MTATHLRMLAIGAAKVMLPDCLSIFAYLLADAKKAGLFVTF